MKMTRYSEPQILAILRQAEGGVGVSDLCLDIGWLINLSKTEMIRFVCPEPECLREPSLPKERSSIVAIQNVCGMLHDELARTPKYF